MAAVSPDTLVGFDIPTAKRVVKATRIVEGMTSTAEGTRNKPVYSVEQIIVPRSGPDVDDLYLCDVYIVNDPEAGTYTLAAEDQYCRVLPSTL